MSRHPYAALLLLLLACTPATPSLDVLGKGLPRGFWWGTATSSHQIEGGNTNDWSAWEQGTYDGGVPHILGAAQSGLADDSWNRFEEDLALMKAAGATAYRFSVEWSRLEPSEGVWDDVALARYALWAHRLRQEGVEPMVTLHHFTIPAWMAAKGGLLSPSLPTHLAALARRVGLALGADVDLWCPINEINVVATLGWLDGTWPPGVKDDLQSQAQVMLNLLKAHALMAAALRAVDPGTPERPTVITTAHHVRVFQPASSSVLDTAIAGLTDDFANESIPRAFKTGRLTLSVPGSLSMDEAVPGLQGSLDLLGLNYYTRDIVRADLGAASLSQRYYRAGRPTSDLGWDLYPEGLEQFLVRFQAYGWPMAVTENGLADAAGTARPAFLAQHVAAIERAVARGADVRGYFHWSLIDNFEWAEGYTARFGLYAVDYAHGLARSPTPAVETFRRIGANVPTR
jgi:beta-glucosidase